MRLLFIGAFLTLFSMKPIFADIDSSAFKADIDAIKEKAKKGESTFDLVHNFAQKYKANVGSVSVEQPAPKVTMRDTAGKEIASFDGLPSKRVLAATAADAAHANKDEKASVTLAGTGGIGDLISGVLGTVMNVGMGILGSL